MIKRSKVAQEPPGYYGVEFRRLLEQALDVLKEYKEDPAVTEAMESLAFVEDQWD